MLLGKRKLRIEFLFKTNDLNTRRVFMFAKNVREDSARDQILTGTGEQFTLD